MKIEINDNRVDALLEKVKPFYENGDPSHDYAHITRVVKMCLHLGEIESANLHLLIPAALLHDIVNIDKNHPDRTKASQLAADEAAVILKEFDYSQDEISKIAQIIIEHSYSLGLEPSSVESAILQDSDRLDAIGAIGLMRTVTCGARMGATYYNLEDPLAENRELNDKNHTLDHFFVKLLKLKDMMNTNEAKSIAVARSQFLEDFVGQLKAEVQI